MKSIFTLRWNSRGRLGRDYFRWLAGSAHRRLPWRAHGSSPSASCAARSVIGRREFFGATRTSALDGFERQLFRHFVGSHRILAYEVGEVDQFVAPIPVLDDCGERFDPIAGIEIVDVADDFVRGAVDVA